MWRDLGFYMWFPGSLVRWICSVEGVVSVAYVKEILQELVESQRNNKKNYNAKDRQSKSEFSKDMCRRRQVQGVAWRMSKKLTWKYEKLCGASVVKLTRCNRRNGGILGGQQISGGHVDGNTQVKADEFWKLMQKRLDLQGSTCRWMFFQ